MELLNTSHLNQILAATKIEQCEKSVVFSWTESQILTALMEQKVFGLIEGGLVMALAIVEWAPDWLELHWIVSLKKKAGYGRKMMEQLEELSARKGYSRVCLEVSVENEAGIRFYKALGFVEDGVRPKYYNGHIDALLLSKALK